jgi:hypothetical protein
MNMPTSTRYFKNETKEFILENFPKNIKILDIGAGVGTYSDILKPLGYEDLDCVEIFQEYITKYGLDKKYKKVYNQNICDLEIDFSEYDLIILGDVLEHIELTKAIDLVKKISVTKFIICVPFESPQGEVYNNQYEIHLQEDLNFFNFFERYPNTFPFCLRFDYGVFTNFKTSVVFVETQQKPIPNEFLIYIINNFDNCKIQDIFDKKKIEKIEKMENKKKHNTTIVTALWNLGRADISEGFKRNYSEYLAKFGELLKTDIPMYIFADKSDEDYIWTIRSKENTLLNIMSLEELKNWFSFTELTSQICKKPDWLSQAGWLSESPQAKLDGYNPLVMSKMFMLNNVTIWNPFNSENFFWIDAGITNTVNSGYFTHDKVFDNLENYLNQNGEFVFISYPYIGGNEVHGFSRPDLAKYCNTDYVRYVCRGGFFGGRKSIVNEINGVYYGYLNNTLNEGLMGTEESVFTIISHNYPDKIHRFEIQDNGLIWPFFEELKKYKNEMSPRNESSMTEIDPSFLLDKVLTIDNNTPIKSHEETALYVIGFNSPNQFKTLIHSMMFYDKNFIDKTKKYLLNNSTDLSTTEQYEALCKSYGFEHIKKDNIGITGGRQWISEHFNESNHKYYMFFEDDMFFHSDRVGYCRNGFNRYISNLYDKVLSIMKKERFDFLKFNFSEFFGDNGTQWSWYNVPQVVRDQYFPDNPKLPTQGLDPNAPRTEFKNIRSVDGLSYITGDVYYSNWPQIMSKEGNKKCFIDTKFQFPYEQTIMSFIFQETKKGNIKPALLLLTPTEHNRFDHYDASLRKEC